MNTPFFEKTFNSFIVEYTPPAASTLTVNPSAQPGKTTNTTSPSGQDIVITLPKGVEPKVGGVMATASQITPGTGNVQPLAQPAIDSAKNFMNTTGKKLGATFNTLLSGLSAMTLAPFINKK